MARLPQPGGDNGTWGNVLNDYLSQALKSDGTLKDNTVTAASIIDGTIQEVKLSSAVQTKLNATGGTPDWSTIANKPAVIAAGADAAAAKTTLSLAKADVGLGNVDNTSDAAKNSAIATLTNKTISGSSNTLSNISQSSVTNLVSDISGKAASVHTHNSIDISDSSATGRSVLTAANASAARTAIGAGTSNLTLGTTGSTAKAGDYQPASTDITDATATGRSLLTATDAAAARTAIDAPQTFTTTAVKTSSYAAAVSDLIPADATSAPFPITLPTAPADKSRVVVKKIDSSTNVVTVTAGGSDVFNKSGSSTTLTLSLQNQAVQLQYKASGAIWYVVSTDVPLGGLDARYAQTSDTGGMAVNVRAPAYAGGAKGDGRPVTVSITGTAITGTGFTSADNGKTIAVAGAGTAGINFITTVTYNSPTSLTAAVSAPTTVSGVAAYLGTDDTAAFQAAIDAAYANQSIYIPKPSGPLGYNYLISGTLQISRAGLSFTGAGVGATAIIYMGNGVLFQRGTDSALTFGTGAMTSGSKVLTGSGFTAGMVGHQINVNGAGAGGITYWSMVASYQSASQVTMVDNASTTVSGATYTIDPWDANLYDGVDGVRFAHLTLAAGPAGTTCGNGIGKYTANTIGIQDWRAGSVQLEDVALNGFDQPFFGVQSDLNHFDNVFFNSSHQGVYLGPRSDQNLFNGCNWIYCDRLIDIDGAAQIIFSGCRFVDNGTTTINGIRLRSRWQSKAANGIVFDRCWFEQLIGLNGVESYIEVGITDGVLDAKQSCSVDIRNPWLVNHVVASGQASITYLITVGNATDIVIEDPHGVDYNGGGGGLDGLVHSVAANNPSIYIRSSQAWNSTQPVVNSGTGTPNVSRMTWGQTGGGWALNSPLFASAVNIQGLSGGNSYLFFNNSGGSNATRGTWYYTGGVNRWTHWIGNNELGSNSGSDWILKCYNDAGGLLYTPLTVTRATGISAFGRALAEAVGSQTLAANGAVTIDAATGNTYAITLAANATSSSITNATIGQKLTIEWVQDGTGSRTYVWPTNCKFAGGTAPAASTTAGYIDSVTFRYDGTNWREVSRAMAIR